MHSLYINGFPLEISLNVRDPPTKINIIPENKVKAEWKLPEVKYKFITRLGFSLCQHVQHLNIQLCFVINIAPFTICSRSELDNLPNNHSCDIIGLVKYVGRTERTRKRGYFKNCL